MSKNASKPQELTNCPCDMAEETANSELCPQTPGVHVKGRDGFFSSIDESLLMLLQETEETHRKQESQLDAVVQLPLSQAGYKAVFSQFFPMEATHSIASAESREGNTILMSHHVTRDDSLTVGVHKAITQHK